MTTASIPDRRPRRDGHGTRPPGSRPGVLAIAMVIVLGSIMTVIDMTIVNVALGRLSQDFHAPVASIQWVTTGYTLALATVIPITAWADGASRAKRYAAYGRAVLASRSAWAHQMSWSSMDFAAPLQPAGSIGRPSPSNCSHAPWKLTVARMVAA